MNIVVCIKQVLDTASPIKVNMDTSSIDTRGLSYVVSPSDRIAVEEAIRIKQGLGFGEVSLVCMGSHSATKALRTCLAMGSDRALLLCSPAFADSDSYATAAVLARVIRSLKYDLILCGAKAADTAAGLVGAVIAEMLDIPMVSGVAEIEVSADHRKVIVQRKLERGDREIVETHLPALLAIEAGHRPRYPRLRATQDGRRMNIKEYDLEALGLSAGEVGVSGSKTKLVKISPPRPGMKKTFIPDSNLPAAERMRLLMEGGATKKEGNILEGEPKEVASKLAQFLGQQKLLPKETSTSQIV